MHFPGALLDRALYGRGYPFFLSERVWDPSLVRLAGVLYIHGCPECGSGCGGARGETQEPYWMIFSMTTRRSRSAFGERPSPDATATVPW